MHEHILSKIPQVQQIVIITLSALCLFLHSSFCAVKCSATENIWFESPDIFEKLTNCDGHENRILFYDKQISSKQLFSRFFGFSTAKFGEIYSSWGNYREVIDALLIPGFVFIAPSTFMLLQVLQLQREFIFRFFRPTRAPITKNLLFYSKWFFCFVWNFINEKFNWTTQKSGKVFSCKLKPEIAVKHRSRCDS